MFANNVVIINVSVFGVGEFTPEIFPRILDKGKGKVHPCTGTEALYRPYAHRGSRGIALHFHDYSTRRG